MKRLTKIEQKRVAVLKDAIAQIKAKSYNVKSYTGYVNADGGTLDDEIEKLAEVCEIVEGKEAHEVELKKYMNKLINPKKPCQVCAKGALLLSNIRKFNNFSLEDANHRGLNRNAFAGGAIYKLFGEANCDLMEKYFELDGGYGDEHDDNIEEWRKKYPDDDERLIAIFKNAIANNGTFKP